MAAGVTPESNSAARGKLNTMGSCRGVHSPCGKAPDPDLVDGEAVTAGNVAGVPWARAARRRKGLVAVEAVQQGRGRDEGCVTWCT